MSCKNTTFEGDIAVGRHVTTGGGINAQGDSVFEKGLKVKGWLDARNIRGACKGLFATPEELDKSYPRPLNGWWALVGNTMPAEVYVVSNHKWIPSGGVVNDLNVELHSYLTKDEAELNYGEAITEINELLGKGAIINPATMELTATSLAAVLSFNYTTTNGVSAIKKISIPASTDDKAGLFTPELLSRIFAAIRAGDDVVEEEINNLRNLVAKLIQPFDDIINIDASKILPNTSSSTEGKIVFNESTGTFVCMVSTIIGNLLQTYEYYSNWIGAEAYGDVVSMSGRVPDANKIYSSHRTFYQWTGQTLDAIAGGDVDAVLSETSMNSVQNRVITNALNALLKRLSDYVLKEELPAAMEGTVEATVDDLTEYPEI